MNSSRSAGPVILVNIAVCALLAIALQLLVSAPG
jgi:hypothetical protein